MRPTRRLHRRYAPRNDTTGTQVPTASPTHFLVKLVLAAPASFLSPAWTSQAFAASVWHFFMKLVSAAPASFLSVACPLQVAVCAMADPATRQKATVNTIDFMD